MEINMGRNCEVDAWASLFCDLVGTASFRLFSGNAVNDRGEATKAAGRWRLHCGFWNTHYAQRSSHGSVCIEKHAWGIFQGIVHRHLCNTDYAARLNKWTNDSCTQWMRYFHTENSTCAETYAKSITQKEIHKYNYAQTILPYKFQMRNHSFWKS